MRSRAVFVAGIAVLVGVGAAGTARAACANRCEATVGEATLDPPLPCFGLESRAETCDCAVLLQVGNGCASPVEATDFRFDTCWTSGQDSREFDHDCSTLEPGRLGSVEVKLSEVGKKEWVFHVEGDDGAHTLHVTSNVESVGDSSDGCSIGRSGAERSSTAARWVAAGVALAGFLARRRVRSSDEP